MNKMRVINRQTGDIFNVKVNPYLPSKAYQAIEKNNPLGYIFFGLYKVFGFYRLNPLRPLLPQSYCY